ncbi:transposase [Kitasatospora sp. NPDC057500]|uniref:transposase n=1 Tax=Kitasatospora sp. NPDC057500 TaxID=3346151 RepID=UPI00367E4903
MEQRAQRGRVYRRFGCLDGHGRQLGPWCVRLREEAGHGSWTYCVDLAQGHRSDMRDPRDPLFAAACLQPGPLQAGACAEGRLHRGSREAAERALDEFAASDPGVRYPAVVRTWRAAWSEFTPCLAFTPAIRTVVYSTNMVESINSRLRKATRNRGHFPTGQAALKVLYLAVRELINPKARDANHVAAHWKEALNQFSLFFEDRLSLR